MVHEGFAADLALIDLATIRERSTFFEPHEYPEGISYVLVNGVFVVDEGELTRAIPGKLLSPATDGPGDRDRSHGGRPMNR
jgi:N-acyl-D-aspartate/D-glutamate deacylase